MSAPQPKLADDRIFKQLEALYSSDEEPNEFLLMRLGQQASKIMHADPGSGIVIQAAIAGLQWQRDEALALSRRAVAVDPGVETLMNAALNVRNVNLVDEACSFVLSAYELAPMNDYVVSRTMFYLAYAGRLHEAARVHTRSSAVVRDSNVSAVLERISSYAESIALMGLSEERLRHELLLAYELLAFHKLRPKDVELEVATDPDGSSSFVATISVTGNLDLEMRLESELAIQLGASDDWNPCVLSVEFKCLQTEDANIPA